ncbi:MAG: DUF418 domain-containing protein [Chloroflexaceae bacterium]|nr:DUF418 domain-containing protein [Chloroflexaceae bacterium]
MNTPKRIQALDILRGFSLFGVLIVNIELFSTPQDKHWDGLVNHIAQGITLFGAEGKFYPIFSLLFGIGFIMQMQSAEKRASNFTQLFGRRLFILFLFGVVHSILFSHFDILTQYACMGVALLFLRHRSPRFLFWASIASLTIPYIIKVAALLLNHDTTASFGINETAYRISIYGQGSVREIFIQRFYDLITYYRAFFDHTMYKIFAMFTLGACVGKLGIFRDIPRYHTKLRKAMIHGLLAGLPGNSIYTITTTLSIPIDFAPLDAALQLLYAFSDLALALFYVSAIALLSQRETWHAILAPLASLGRMSLTTYIMQSVICTTIFYSYGLGLYGQISPASTLIIACVIYALQMAFSMFWLSHFTSGPLELALATAYLLEHARPAKDCPAPHVVIVASAVTNEQQQAVRAQARASDHQGLAQSSAAPRGKGCHNAQRD